MKKIISIITCVLFICSCNITCFAQLPNKFWGINENYSQALKAKDYRGIIQYGNQIVNLMKTQPESDQKRDIMISRLREIGFASENIGNYEESLKAFKSLYEYTKPLGSKYKDVVNLAKSRIIQYTSELNLYTDNGKTPFFNSVNEKKNGVLFGVCSNSGTRNVLENESMVLVYQELGQNLLPYNENIIRQASDGGYTVEFALNCPKEGGDIRNINSMTSYLEEISSMFSKYPAVPVYLRFAAEFDVWTDMVDAPTYINAFRYVSQFFKSRNRNVAIVWSPNQISNANVERDDYYPGDAYVDWVGVSLYCEKYFLGDKNQSLHNNIYFQRGDSSNPVIVLRDLVEKYGNKKPIMISESGCGHYVNSENENATDFALQRLKELYVYVPMVYPQVKLIAYFDYMIPGAKNDFRLSSNSILQKEFINLTKSDVYIQHKYSSDVDFSYRKIVNGTNVNSVFPVSAYAHIYGKRIEKVTYYIDGNYAGTSDKMPFSVYIDALKYKGGIHKLKAIASTADGKTISSELNINITDTNKNIHVKINNENAKFSQRPIIFNDRTMVPMRDIFQKLGATVSWDANTKTATGIKDGKVVKLTIGRRIMYVNNEEVVIDSPAILLSGYTLVPARAVAQALGCDVLWDGETSTVAIE